MDEVLVKKTLSGDKTAFNQLVAKYQTQVYGLAVNYLRNFSDAEDLAQEAFLRAYLSLHQLREPAKFGNWLYKITQNVCREWLRRKTNHEEMIERIRMNEIKEQVPTPDELAGAKELKERIHHAIDALPEQERLVVTLYYMDGLTQHDIADFVGVSESTVKRRLRSSQKRLKGELLIMVQENLQKHDLTSEFTDKVAIEVENLEAAIRRAIGKPEGPILKSDLKVLTELQSHERNITDLNGIEYCINLRRLHLYQSQIIDISPLSSLTNLPYLHLQDNPIMDISQLSNLTNLQLLSLENTQISDISHLAKLTDIRVLYLDDNLIQDISTISVLKKIGDWSGWMKEVNGVNIHLGLSYNQIEDISPLVNNPGIGEGDVIDLTGNPLNDEAYDVHIPALQERGVNILLTHRS